MAYWDAQLHYDGLPWTYWQENPASYPFDPSLPENSVLARFELPMAGAVTLTFPQILDLTEGPPEALSFLREASAAYLNAASSDTEGSPLLHDGYRFDPSDVVYYVQDVLGYTDDDPANDGTFDAEAAAQVTATFAYWNDIRENANYGTDTGYPVNVVTWEAATIPEAGGTWANQTAPVLYYPPGDSEPHIEGLTVENGEIYRPIVYTEENPAPEGQSEYVASSPTNVLRHADDTATEGYDPLAVSMTDDSNFTFTGAYFSTTDAKTQITATAYDDAGVASGTYSFWVDGDTPREVDFTTLAGFDNVDEVHFSAEGQHFALDDFKWVAYVAPEPPMPPPEMLA